jgi:nucleoid-associated protein YgaU
MKATVILFALVSLLASCSQKGNPVAPAANTGNQYGVPNSGAPGGYNPPYQPVAPINPPATQVPAPYGTPAVAIAPYTPPTTTPAPAPAPSPDLNGNVYTIKAGDSLWGIARKFGTSVNAVKETNGMTSNTIIEGRSLIIPGR